MNRINYLLSLFVSKRFGTCAQVINISTGESYYNIMGEKVTNDEYSEMTKLYLKK